MVKLIPSHLRKRSLRFVKMNSLSLCLLTGAVAIVASHPHGRLTKKCEFCCSVISKSLLPPISLSVLESFKTKSKSILFSVLESQNKEMLPVQIHYENLM